MQDSNNGAVRMTHSQENQNGFRRAALAIGAVLMIGGCAPTSAGDDTEPFAGLAEGWNQIAAPEHTSCAHGTDYSFWFRPASTDNVAIYFQGGGACWMGEICALDRQPSYDPFVDESDTPPTSGIFDFASEENPIQDWSVLYVPYCTGDIHVGTVTRSYDVTANDSLPAGTVQIQHAGDANATAALAWLYDRIDDPAQVLVTGVSAGSLGSAVFAHEVASRFPKADVVQLGDASGGYRAPDAVPAVLSAWGAKQTLERVTATTLDRWSFESVYMDKVRSASNLRMAQINYHEDEVQLSFLALLGQRDVRLIDLLDANLEEIETSSTDFSSYILPGRRHGIIRDDVFFDAVVDGVRLRDWTASLIDGEEVTSVDCAECR